MILTLIDKDMLRAAIASNTDASEQDAKEIINTVLLRQRKVHGGECEHDSISRSVCEGIFAEKCDDVLGLCEALRAVLALAGESAEIRSIVDKAISEHGGPDVD